MTPHLAVVEAPKEQKEAAPYGSFDSKDVVAFMMGKAPSHKMDEMIVYMQGSLFNPNHYDLPQDKGLSFEGKLQARIARIQDELKKQYPVLANIEATAKPEAEVKRLGMEEPVDIVSMCTPVRRWVADGGRYIYQVGENEQLTRFEPKKAAPAQTLQLV